MRRLFTCLLFVSQAFPQQPDPTPAQPRYDCLIRHARIVDGAANPWFLGDVAISGGRIAAVGTLGDVSAKYTLDATGLTLSPGFIDSHSHGLAGLQRFPAAENLIRQGVTTILEGPDGSSPLPIAAFLAQLESKKIGVNFGLLAGHGTIRGRVMNSENRPATPEELERMQALMRQAMLDGAFGLSTGLFYVPGNFAPTEEVVALARIAGEFGGIHTSHMRDEAARVLDSVKETIRIGEEGRLPTQVTHHKIIGKANWGLSKETLRLVEEARARGVDATIDMYPYTASSTGTGALFPQWSLSGGAKALTERLAAPESRRRIKEEIVFRILNDRGAGDPRNVVVASCGFDPSLAGKNLAQISQQRGRTTSPEDAAETAIELQLKGGCSAIYHAISEDDLERILRYPFTMVASDGGILVPGPDMPHPRNYGTFARILARYVRERHTLSLEEAVHKMSGLPAQRLGLRDRGLILPGMQADLVLFDPAKIQDLSTFEKPHQYATGVHSVWVNGKLALSNGRLTGEQGGAILRGPGYRKPEPRADLLITPRAAGPVTAQSSEKQLIETLGSARVKPGKVYVGEGEYEPCTWLDEEQPTRSLAILWKDPQARRQPTFLRFCDNRGPGSPYRCDWRTVEGITLGTTLKQLEALNGGPFEMSGFGWDYSGHVYGWKQGKLERAYAPAILVVRLGVKPEQTSLPEYKKVEGDRQLPSSRPEFQKLNPQVRQLFLEFAP